MNIIKAIVKSIFKTRRDRIAHEGYMDYMRAEYKNEYRFIGTDSVAARMAHLYPRN